MQPKRPQAYTIICDAYSWNTKPLRKEKYRTYNVRDMYIAGFGEKKSWFYFRTFENFSELDYQLVFYSIVY